MDFKKIEKKWQARWEKKRIFRVKEGKKKKLYILEMLPYPSSSGLHMGHIRNYSIGDCFARFKRMQGFNVLYPMGYDAFGLPAENAAIKSRTHPKKYTERAIAGIRKNQKALGLSYDWTREIATCYPEYYKWNQWIFLRMLKKGLAYKREAPVNWCPRCETVLANEQVENGRCWRCESRVEIRNLEQWFFRITKYADRLLKGLDKIDWPGNVKKMQENWIGRSEGTRIDFKIKDTDKTFSVFTTRPDTYFGITFMVYAPEHPDVMELVKGTKYEKGVREFINRVLLKEKFERTSEETEKEGMFIGRYAVNPITKKKIPIYIANFVLLEYGTGAIIGVPAHDQRDFMFARKYKIPIRVVIQPPFHKLDPKEMTRAYVERGKLDNSGKFNGMDNIEAIDEITKFLEKGGVGKATVEYKLRDWLISRQRYWGTPIPIVYCKKCGIVPVPEKDLPVLLPTNVKPTGHGNPLSKLKSFTETRCPKCRGPARRETDTMDTFMDSNWYFLRYCSPRSRKMFDRKAIDYWMPVDHYIGGVEHAVMHLLYARFFTMVLKDLKLLGFDEPFLRLFNQGIVYKDGHKMSKSFGNAVTQEEIGNKYGIDTARLFLLFVSSPESQFEWSDKGIIGSYRFLARLFNLAKDFKKTSFSRKKGNRDKLMESRLHSLIKQVTEHMEGFRFNKAIGAIMGFANELQKYQESRPNRKVFQEALKRTVTILSPFAPHLMEECWEMLGGKGLISLQPWPRYDRRKIDKRAEALETMVSEVYEDIYEILKLARIKKPRKISLYVSPKWKYGLFRALAKQLKKTREQGSIMKSLMREKQFRQYGKEISRLISQVLKSPDRLPGVILDQEFQRLSAERESLRKEFKSEIEILKAEARKSEKAGKAEPGKPGIEVI